MNCSEAQIFVSVLYDGEEVPAEAVRHIRGCLSCQQELRDYAAMGVEFKLAAIRTEDPLPTLAWLVALPRRRRFSAARALTARVMVPRFALGLAAVVILVLSIGINFILAQSPARWLEFQIYPAGMAKPEHFAPHVARAGYREPMSWFWNARKNNGTTSVNKVGVMVSIMHIEKGSVRLAVRARRYDENPNPERDLGNLQGHEYTYIPGQTLEIPIEGGGTLLFRGQVSQEQPKLAWGFPLEPGADQMILTHFVLLRDGQALLHAPSGASSMVDKKDNCGIVLYVPGYGLFTFALQPFEGAVKGEASWTQAKFKIDGHQFYLLSGTPITGGDQPRDIWVSLNPDFLSGGLHGVALSARPLQNQGNATGEIR